MKHEVQVVSDTDAETITQLQMENEKLREAIAEYQDVVSQLSLENKWLQARAKNAKKRLEALAQA